MHPHLIPPLRRAAEDLRIHQAEDGSIEFEANDGELVVAVDDGEVVELRYEAAGGLSVTLAHEWGESRYARGQLRSIPAELTLGHTVRRGERIFLATSPALVFGLTTHGDDDQSPLKHLGLPEPKKPARARK